MIIIFINIIIIVVMMMIVIIIEYFLNQTRLKLTCGNRYSNGVMITGDTPGTIQESSEAILHKLLKTNWKLLRVFLRVINNTCMYMLLVWSRYVA